MASSLILRKQIMASIASTTLSVPGRLESETQHPHKHQKYTRLRAMWLILTAVGGSTNGLRKYHGMFTHAIYSNVSTNPSRDATSRNCTDSCSRRPLEGTKELFQDAQLPRFPRFAASYRGRFNARDRATPPSHRCHRPAPGLSVQPAIDHE